MTDNLTLPIASTEAAHTPPPFPSENLSNAAGQAEQERALDRAYIAEAQDSVLTPSTSPTIEASVAEPSEDSFTFGEQREMQNEQLIEADQMQGEARQAQMEESVPFLGQPLEVDNEAMKENFTTDLTEESRQQPLLEHIQNVPDKEEGEAVLNTDFLNAVEEGDRQKLVQEELQAYVSGEEGGILTNTFKVIDYIFAPAMAPLAAIEGGLAYAPNEADSFIGQLVGTGVAAGDAFNERMFRWFDPDGGMMPQYSEAIVEKFLPGVPEEHRATTGMVLELLLTVPTGLGMAKYMQNAIAMTNSLDRTKDFQGLMKETVYSYLGWKPGEPMDAATKEILSQIGDGTPEEVARGLLEDAARVQEHGSQAAFVKLSEQLGLTKGKNIMGTDEAIRTVKELMGDSANNSVLVERATDQGELALGLKERQAFNELRFNTSSTYSADDFINGVNKAEDKLVEVYKQKHGTIEDVPLAEGGFVSRPNAQAIEAARVSQMQLESLMGVPIQRMSGAEADAMKTILASSMKQLGEYAAIMDNPAANMINQGIAKTAFAKQLINHHMIAAKIQGFGSVAGQNLGSMNRAYYNELLERMNIRVC